MFSPQDFIPPSNLCRHCLTLFKNTNSQKKGLQEICPGCRQALTVNTRKRNKLWKKQLNLFLNYKPKKSSSYGLDVLVAYSGGIDSTIALYLARRQFRLNVLAVQFRNPWQRSVISRLSEQFCLKHRIPLIVISVDLKSVFLQNHKDVYRIKNGDIFNFPWCELCAEGGGYVWKGINAAAKFLNITRVISGNNFAHFLHSLPQLEGFNQEVKAFIRQNKEFLLPTSILEFYPDSIGLSLLKGLRYSKKRERETLRKINYRLPDNYFRTTESDCNLGILLPCIARSFGPASSSPRGSAYQEFLSGTLSREEWKTSLLRAINFTREDSEAALKFMKKSLFQHVSSKPLTLRFNRFSKKFFKQFDREEFAKELTNAIEREEIRILRKYFFEKQQFMEAVKLEKGFSLKH